LKLVQLDRIQWQSRAHFLAIAAQAMRHILVNHALRRKRAKRGGGAAHVPLDEVPDLPVEEADRILALDEALARLTAVNPRHAPALELLKRAGDRRREGYVHSYLGSLHRGRGRFDEALSELTLSLAINREMGDRMYESQTIGNLGNLHVEMGSLEEARACYESAVAMNRETGDRRNEGLFLSNLGSLTSGSTGSRKPASVSRGRSRTIASSARARWRATHWVCWGDCRIVRADSRRHGSS
jgi:tetratricopeptide (TPR) repeat protein